MAITLSEEFYDEEGPSKVLSFHANEDDPRKRRSSEGEALASKESKAVKRTKVLVGLVMVAVALWLVEA